MTSTTPTDRRWWQKKRHMAWYIPLALVVFIAVTTSGGDTTDAAKPMVDTQTNAAANPAPDPEPEPEPVAEEPAYYTPKPDDFDLKVKTLEKECFGSAGCNVTFRVELEYLGIQEFDPDETYELTYEIKGGEDPMIDTMEIQGDEYESYQEQYIGTTSSNAKLRAVVTDLTARGF
jgi:hypothetical protein